MIIMQNHWPSNQLEAGNTVRFKPNKEIEWRRAVILPRSYVLRDERGKLFRSLNRRQLVKTEESMGRITQYKEVTMSTPDSDSLPTQSNESYHDHSKNDKLTTHLQTGSGRIITRPRRLIEET